MAAMKKIAAFALVLFPYFAFSQATKTAGAQETVKSDHLQVRLVTAPSDSNGVLNLGVHFKIDPEWHIYWLNPGDSGTAPTFQFTGATLERVGWPYPDRLPVAHLTNFGYEREVLIPLRVRDAQPTIKLNLEWLVCKVECVPGFAEFEFAAKDLASEPDLLKQFADRVPSESGDWTTEKSNGGSNDNGGYAFELASSSLKPEQIKSLFVYPEDGERFTTKLPQIEPNGDRFKIVMPISGAAQSDAKSAQAAARFTFVAETTSGETIFFTREVRAKEARGSLFLGILLAIVGGAILNFMPCVFPILFLKAYGFIKEPDLVKIRTATWAYSAGVVLSFAVFGGLLTALRLSGEAIGWGYQLQNPFVVYGLALLFFLMALNFHGYFEFGDAIAGRAGDLGRSKFFSGSFGTGVLAVVVASPCTAPFMGSALGLTLLLPPVQSILIFAALGLGMALPMILLAYIPALVKRLPRSGPWMIVVKQLMSFPLLATALWLLWVLGNQKGTNSIFAALASFLLIVFGIWMRQSSSRAFVKVAAWVAIAAAPVFAVYAVAQATNPEAAAAAPSAWAPYDAAVIAEKRKSQPVFIDFTATWCITCQVNKQAVLNTDAIQDVFKKHDVYLVRADWTNRDPKITAALAAFRRNSVPFYVYYEKSGEAKTLPELLTKDIVIRLFEGERK